MNRAGFSLVELMVVVCVVGILSAIAIPNYIAMTSRAKEAGVKSNTYMAQLVAEDFAVAHDGTYPTLAELINVALWPGGVALPTNPFTGVAMIIGAPGFSSGNIGYSLVGDTYTLEGYGVDATAGPAGNGVLLMLTNG